MNENFENNERQPTEDEILLGVIKDRVVKPKIYALLLGVEMERGGTSLTLYTDVHTSLDEALLTAKRETRKSLVKGKKEWNGNITLEMFVTLNPDVALKKILKKSASVLSLEDPVKKPAVEKKTIYDYALDALDYKNILMEAIIRDGTAGDIEKHSYMFKMYEKQYMYETMGLKLTEELKEYKKSWGKRPQPLLKRGRLSRLGLK